MSAKLRSDHATSKHPSPSCTNVPVLTAQSPTGFKATSYAQPAPRPQTRTGLLALENAFATRLYALCTCTRVRRRALPRRIRTRTRTHTARTHIIQQATGVRALLFDHNAYRHILHSTGAGSEQGQSAPPAAETAARGCRMRVLANHRDLSFAMRSRPCAVCRLKPEGGRTTECMMFIQERLGHPVTLALAGGWSHEATDEAGCPARI